MGAEKAKLRRLITGDYPALRAAFLAEVARLREEDTLVPVIVLVTSHLLGLHLGRHLADKGLAYLNLYFLTLEDLAERVAARTLHEKGMKEVPRFAPELIIRAAVNRFASGSDRFYFSSIADRTGFHKALLATIGDLKNACLSPKDLESTLKDPKAVKSVNQAKIKDLKKIWEAYEADLASHQWYDEYDMMRAARGLLTQTSLLRRASAVLAYGFYDFNALEKCMLRACFQARPTTVFVPYKPTRAYEFVKPIIAWLARNGFEPIEAEVAESEPSKPAVLSHLSDRLFSGGEAVEEVDDGLIIISAPGELREVREAFRHIATELTCSGPGLHECGILLRSPETYAGIIRQTAESLGLDPYVPEGLRLTDTRPGRSLVLLMDIMRHDFTRQAVMEFVTFARLRPPFSGDLDTANEPASWDVISMEAGIVGGVDEWDERLRILLTDITREHDDSEPGWRRMVPGGAPAIKALRKFMKVLIRGLAAVRKEKTWPGRTRMLQSVFTELVEHESSTKEILKALDNLVLIEDLEIPREDVVYYDTVREVLGTTKLQMGRFERNGPAVLDLMAARGIPFETVIIPGMVEKGFPPIVRQDAILLDHEREAINLATSGDGTEAILFKARRRLEEERLLFRLATGSATRRLILSYPRIEMVTAKERLPSSFLLAAAETITGTKVDFSTLETLKFLRRIPLARIAVEAPLESLDEVEYDLSTVCRDLPSKKPDAVLLLRKLSPTFQRALKLESERWGKRSFTCYDGVICSEAAQKELRSKYSIINEKVSPTRLETYATCPYRYLLGRIMRIAALVEPERAHKLSPIDRGDIVHRILWRFFTKLAEKRKTGLTVEERDRDLLYAVAKEEFDDFEKRGITGFPALWSLEKERIMSWLDGFMDAETDGSEFRPTYFEVRYGMKQPAPYESEISTEKAVPLIFGKYRVLLTGRIDRIDVSHDAKQARIIDYKTGEADAKRQNEFLGGRSLQLPLYLHAAHGLLQQRHPGIVPMYAEYYHLRESGTKMHVRFDAEALTSKRKELESMLTILADSIEQGRFFAVPGGQCENCDFYDICGSGRQTIFEMKAADPSVRDYLAMSEEAESKETGKDSK